MELLDRYLQAVKKHLPIERQDDILAELRANLESQLEDKEAELGRPLTRAEAEAWIRQLGAPLQVAARYRPQQYLIGPALFPMYWFVLRNVFVWSLVVYAIVCAVQLASRLSGHFANADAVTQAIVESIVQAIVGAPGVILTMAAWVTGIFAVLEYSVARGLVKLPNAACLNNWNPGELPPIDPDASGGGKPRPYAHAVAEVIFGFILLAWMLLIPWHPFLLLGPGVFAVRALPYTLAPVWWTFYWWIVALNAVQLAWRCFDLIRERWQGPRRVQHIVVKLFGLIPMAILLLVRDHAYLLLKAGAAGEPQLGPPLGQINDYIFKGLLVVFAISTIQFLFDLWKTGYEDWKQRAGGML